MRTLEFFAGIGGLKAACPWLDVQAALDIDQDARYVYTSNFAGNYICCELGSVQANQIEKYKADLWWMTPPCTPFTQKGKRKDYTVSQSGHQLVSQLQQAGFETRIIKRCPTQSGWPNRRQRIYLLALRYPVPQQVYQHIIQDWAQEPTTQSLPTSLPRRLSEFLDHSITRDQKPKLWLDESTCQQYHQSIDRVNPDDAQAIAACFGSSYGKAINRSGSYLWHDNGYRRFSPREVANLLGFPKEFILPETLSDRRLWHLLGNSLSLPIVRELMQFTLANE